MSADELADDGYQERLEKLGENLDFKDFVKTHPMTAVVHEDLALDWFYFENRLRRLCFNLVKPVVLQQKRQRGKIGYILKKLDNYNMKMFALDGELAKFKYDLKFVEKALNDCDELNRRVASLEDRLEARHNDQTKRLQTVSDKQKASDGAIRGLEKDI